MSLSDTDIGQVRDVVIDAIQAVVVPRFDALETDIAEIKADVGVLKEDVHVLKEDVHVLKIEMREVKEDVRTLKTEMREVKDTLGRLDGRLESLEADVKELYSMVTVLTKSSSTVKKLAAGTSVEQKVLQMYADFQLLAKEAGVTLPR